MNENSFARELLADMKKTNKRLFIIWLCTFFGLLLSIGYIVYLLNDISVVTTEEYKQEITDVEKIENSSINNGE